MGCRWEQRRESLRIGAGGAQWCAAVGWPFPCEVEPAVFEVPPGYTVLGAGRNEPLRDEDDDLLQFAIQQSLLDAGTETEQVGALPARPRPPRGRGDREATPQPRSSQVTVWEALTNTRPGPRLPPYDEELQLERCVRLRSRGSGGRNDGRSGAGSEGGAATALSRRALQESLLLQAGPGPADSEAAPANPGYGGFAEQLRLAMALSEREQEERERRRREEDEELQRILRLSLTDK